jgi:ribonuclease D
LAYLAGDVAHLLELDSLLWQQVTQMGIEDEVATETAYRLVEALQSEIPQGPPHLRIRGYTRLDGLGLRVIESIAVQREALAEARNLPPQRVIGDKLLLTLAARRPRTRKEMLRFGQLTRLHDEELDRILASIRQAVADGPRAAMPRAKPMPQQQVEARRGRQERLAAWRRSEARRRNIHEQVVLPTHCIRWLTAMAPVCLEGIVRMPGLGHARAERYAQRLLSILQEP